MFSRPDGSCRLEGYCTADVAKHCAGDDARFLAVLLSRTGAIEAYSTTQRCFTDQQRHAMTARDRGCTFPGCNRPPGWGQTHHVTEHRNAGPTTLDNGVLLCGHHHRTFEHAGWTVQIRDGQPWSTPLARPPPTTHPQHRPTTATPSHRRILVDHARRAIAGSVT